MWRINPMIEEHQKKIKDQKKAMRFLKTPQPKIKPTIGVLYMYFEEDIGGGGHMH